MRTRSSTSGARRRRPSAGILLLAIAITLPLVACVDGPSFVNVDNQSDTTYIAQIGSNEFRIVPPRSKVTVAQIGFVEPAGPKLDVRFRDESCAVVATTVRQQQLVVISPTGTFTITQGSDAGGALDTARESRFCALPDQPSPSVAANSRPSIE